MLPNGELEEGEELIDLGETCFDTLWKTTVVPYYQDDYVALVRVYDYFETNKRWKESEGIALTVTGVEEFIRWWKELGGYE